MDDSGHCLRELTLNIESISEEGEIMNLILKLSYLSCLSDIHMEILRRQLDKWVWSSEVRFLIDTNL